MNRPLNRWLLLAVLLGSRYDCWIEPVAAADGPRMLVQEAGGHDPGVAGGTTAAFAIMRMPGGKFAFYDRNHPQQVPLTLKDRTGKPHVLLPSPPAEILQSETILNSGVLNNNQVILTPDQRVLGVTVQAETIPAEEIAKVGLPRYLNVWLKQASREATAAPLMIWRGYNGSQMEYEQLPSGRILVPYGSFLPHGKTVPPHGRHQTIIQWSDDGGKSWHESESRLVAPCYHGFNGSNEGACEPAIERLADGRIWMLMRTQAGFLYESFSTDDGKTWSPAAASRFSTSTGPPNIMRHSNGWLVVCWNNCEMPPRADGQGVYGGRDALHIAVSADEGKTWRGFREIYLDHRRHDNPARSGDRGTAYPLGASTADGQIVVLAGQGTGGRNPILIDPNWIVETTRESNFTQGLEDWSVYKHHGAAVRWWRARAVGCALVEHPNQPGARCLQVHKPDDLPADGATWNFPNGWAGTVSVRLQWRPGCQGGAICLNDRMFDPCNDYGEEFSVFRLDLTAAGKLGETQLEPLRWYEVTLAWDLGKARCEILIDGEKQSELPVRHPTLNGVSYLRLRSTARQVDPAGFLIEKVKATISDPVAPPTTPEQQRDHEARYIQEVVPTWK